MWTHYPCLISISLNTFLAALVQALSHSFDHSVHCLVSQNFPHVMKLSSTTVVADVLESIYWQVSLTFLYHFPTSLPMFPRSLKPFRLKSLSRGLLMENTQTETATFILGIFNCTNLKEYFTSYFTSTLVRSCTGQPARNIIRSFLLSLIDRYPSSFVTFSFGYNKFYTYKR